MQSPPLRSLPGPHPRPQRLPRVRSCWGHSPVPPTALVDASVPARQRAQCLPHGNYGNCSSKKWPLSGENGVYGGVQRAGGTCQSASSDLEGSCVLSLSTEAVETAGHSPNPTSQESPLDLIVGPSSRSQPVPCLTEHLAGVQEQGFLQERTRLVLGVSGGL